LLTTETFRKAARDPAEFGSYYLSHYFTRRSPPFHRQLSALWRRRVMKNRDPVSDCAAMLTEKGTRSAIAAPRGHAKSTVMSLQNVLHAALFGYKRYILLVSDTEAQAVSFLDAIKNELETNERILADFGEQPGKTWKTGSILLSNGCRIDAVGSGQKLRGRRNYERRPDLILCDDIENDEGVRTAEQRQKTADWFWKAVCKSGDSYTDILVIGTILHHDSLLAGLLENPGFQSRKYRAVLSDATSPLWTDWERLVSDLTDPDREKTAHAFYFKHRKEMLAGAKVLWPEKLSYYDLRLMRLTEGDAAFNSEMQNQPVVPVLQPRRSGLPHRRLPVFRLLRPLSGPHRLQRLFRHRHPGGGPEHGSFLCLGRGHPAPPPGQDHRRHSGKGAPAPPGDRSGLRPLRRGDQPVPVVFKGAACPGIRPSGPVSAHSGRPLHGG